MFFSSLWRKGLREGSGLYAKSSILTLLPNMDISPWTCLFSMLGTQNPGSGTYIRFKFPESYSRISLSLLLWL